MNWFFNSNTIGARLSRTVVQGVLGVLVANVDVFLGYTTVDIAMKPVIAATVMAVLSPIMGEIGKAIEKDGKPDELTDGK